MDTSENKDSKCKIIDFTIAEYMTSSYNTDFDNIPVNNIHLFFDSHASNAQSTSDRRVSLAGQMLSKLVEDIIGLSRQFTLAKTESIKFK
jgi:hypothetical protein